MALPQTQSQQNNDEQTQTESEESPEQRRGIARAESYTRLRAFSHARLIRQLEFEGFPLMIRNGQLISSRSIGTSRY